MVGETFCDKHYRIKRSVSDLHAFEFILDGKGVLDINGQHLIPQKNDIFLLTEGSRHCYYADAKDPWHKIYVVFRGKMANALISSYLPKNTYLFRNCAAEPVFQTILQVAASSVLSYPQKVDMITLELIRLFSYLRNQTVSLRADLADRIRQKLNDYIDKPFTMDVLCSEMHYSKNHIINVFRKKYKMTPYVYYNKKRIEAAKYYLKNTQCSSAGIAQVLHYTDAHYFANCFKKETGLTPARYRQEAGL